jgi:DNA-binding MarR family transcriptional regulator
VSSSPIRVGEDFETEFPGASARAVEAGVNLVHTSALLLDEINRHRSAVAPLSPSASQVLAVLDGAGEPLSSTEIADRLLVTTASMTSLLDTLERRALVLRVAHPSDRRKILVDITDEGRRIVDEMLPVVHAASSRALGRLSDREQETLTRILGKVQRHLSELADEGLPSPAPRRRPASPLPAPATSTVET